MLIVIGMGEEKKVNGLEIVKVDELSVSDLANCGARLTLFTENAIEDLENLLLKEKVKKDKDNKKEIVKKDVRKLKRENRKKKPKIKKIKNKSEGDEL